MTPFLWLNDSWLPLERARLGSLLGLNDVLAAEQRLNRFVGLLSKLFPELMASGGLIESPLHPAEALQKALLPAHAHAGRWFIKADHALLVAGSIKARGGIYEVLAHAETLAVREGLLKPGADPLTLASPEALALFSRHEISVGSTGNLALSIGLIAAALGFRATVHMSSNAKEWKKARLRTRGVEVIEHQGDYGRAVAAGREQARNNPNAHFVDDENSQQLFVGYSVAALRLAQQLTAASVRIDKRHPLFIYLPCGVGGAPGGITFGLRHLFGDHVHCFFAEPLASPCMLVRLASVENRSLSVTDFGLTNETEADGLAVGRASEFVASMMRPLVSGIYTVPDDDLFLGLYLLDTSLGLHIEPSAAAGFNGPRWLLEHETGRSYLENHDLVPCLNDATHVLWTTGGHFVPQEEYSRFRKRGQVLNPTR
jgi:D-serine dehydratase